MAVDPQPTAVPVTVVVPTCNRRDFATELVRRLQAQSHAAFRAVLVDDGSTDGTVEALRTAIADDDRFHLETTANRGPAAARNTGWRPVTTEWVAFTDDDCLPDPVWLAELLAAAVAEGADIVQGRTVPDPTLPPEQQPWFVRSQSIGSWSGRFQTCNLLVRAGRLREVGGFDERFPPDGFGEDVDLGLRATAQGATTAFASGAVVVHRVLPMSYVGFLRRRHRWAQVVRLVAVNPSARVIFPYRYIAHRSHAAFWLALPVSIGAAAVSLWPVPLGMVLAYSAGRAVKTRARGRPVPIRMAWGLAELTGVVVGAVAFAAASVRFRRLLL